MLLLPFLLFSEEEARVTYGYIFDRYPSSSHSSSLHWIQQAPQANDLLEMEDGSLWRIHSYDLEKTRAWASPEVSSLKERRKEQRLGGEREEAPSHPLIITQNSRWFTSYPYRIVNKNTGESVEATLYLGPKRGSEWALSISSLDLSRGEIILNNLSCWEVALSDSYAFEEWSLGDSIIIGENSGWDGSYEAILINADKKQFVHATQF